jgi:hypothetical protein
MRMCCLFILAHAASGTEGGKCNMVAETALIHTACCPKPPWEAAGGGGQHGRRLQGGATCKLPEFCSSRTCGAGFDQFFDACGDLLEQMPMAEDFEAFHQDCLTYTQPQSYESAPSWVLGTVGQTCDEVCAQLAPEKSCTEDVWPTTLGEMKILAKRFKFDCTDFEYSDYALQPSRDVQPMTGAIICGVANTRRASQGGDHPNTGGPLRYTVYSGPPAGSPEDEEGLKQFGYKWYDQNELRTTTPMPRCELSGRKDARICPCL